MNTHIFNKKVEFMEGIGKYHMSRFQSYSGLVI